MYPSGSLRARACGAARRGRRALGGCARGGGARRRAARPARTGAPRPDGRAPKLLLRRVQDRRVRQLWRTDRARRRHRRGHASVASGTAKRERLGQAARRARSPALARVLRALLLALLLTHALALSLELHAAEDADLGFELAPLALVLAARGGRRRVASVEARLLRRRHGDGRVLTHVHLAGHGAGARASSRSRSAGSRSALHPAAVEQRKSSIPGREILPVTPAHFSRPRPTQHPPRPRRSLASRAGSLASP